MDFPTPQSIYNVVTTDFLEFEQVAQNNQSTVLLPCEMGLLMIEFALARLVMYHSRSVQQVHEVKVVGDDYFTMREQIIESLKQNENSHLRITSIKALSLVRLASSFLGMMTPDQFIHFLALRKKD